MRGTDVSASRSLRSSDVKIIDSDDVRLFSSSAHRPGNAGGGKASPPSQSVPQKESEAYKQPIREDEVAKKTYPASIEELLSTMSQDINHIFLALSKSEGQPAEEYS